MVLADKSLKCEFDFFAQGHLVSWWLWSKSELFGPAILRCHIVVGGGWSGLFLLHFKFPQLHLLVSKHHFFLLLRHFGPFWLFQKLHQVRVVLKSLKCPDLLLWICLVYHLLQWHSFNVGIGERSSSFASCVRVRVLWNRCNSHPCFFEFFLYVDVVGIAFGQVSINNLFVLPQLVARVHWGLKILTENAALLQRLQNLSRFELFVVGRKAYILGVVHQRRNLCRRTKCLFSQVHLAFVHSAWGAEFRWTFIALIKFRVTFSDAMPLEHNTVRALGLWQFALRLRITLGIEALDCVQFCCR